MNLYTRNILGASLAILFIATTAIPVQAQTPPPAPAEKAAATKQTHAAGSAHVKAIQEALNKSGANLKVDGFMGKDTHAALKKFQSEHKLKDTGTANKETLKALGVE
jgi:peptidoglycan hydrolase-like protein with peptidoglycan-binding domain